jgi:hypothetical protein
VTKRAYQLQVGDRIVLKIGSVSCDLRLTAIHPIGQLLALTGAEPNGEVRKYVVMRTDKLVVAENSSLGG